MQDRSSKKTANQGAFVGLYDAQVDTVTCRRQTCLKHFRAKYGP